MKKIVLIMLIAFCTISLVYSGGQKEVKTPQENVIKIGVLLPLSGKMALDGEYLKAGYDLGAYIVNNAVDADMPLARTIGLPALGNAKIELVYADDQGLPEKGMSETERLITSEKVVAITGSYTSSVTATAQMIAERHKFPFLNALASSPMLNKKGLEWFFRTTPDDEILLKSFFDFLKDLKQRDNVAYQRIAIIHEDSLWGTDCANIVDKYAKEYSYNVVEKVSFPSGTVDLSSEVSKLKKSNPDILLEICFAQDQILLINTMKLLDFNVEMIFSGVQYPAIFKALGNDAEGMIFREVFNEDFTKKNKNAQIVSELWHEKNSGGFGNAPRAIDGIIVLADAINRAGSTDPVEIQKALKETDIPADKLFLPWNGVKFNSNGLNIKSNGILVQYLNGELHQIWPFDSSITDVSYPLHKWRERK